MYEAEDYSFTPEVDGWVEKWSISPELPSGLHLDDSDGTISGVPFGPAAEGTYTIVASNEVGETQTPVKFLIQQGVPKMLTYTPNVTEHCLLVDVELIPQCMSATGSPVTVTEYSIDTPLPEGYELNTTTGVISGKPQKVQPLSTYQITAQNTMGKCQMMMAFEVLDMPPSDLTYPGIDEYYGSGETVSILPQCRGSANHWSIEPELPAGLSFDPQKGTISGVPQALSPETEYTVSCSNPLGGTSCQLTFEIVAGRPDEVVYPELGTALKVGQGMRFEPVVLPFGAGATFEVSPPLPEGMELNPTVGTVSGAPSKVTPKTKYTFKATNLIGSVECTVEFECFMPSDDPMVVDEAFAAKLEEVIEIDEMPDEPSKKDRAADWMIWMVHRAWLNDPTLKTFDFSHMQMPLPKEEPRIQPKLARSIKTNTNIVTLLLNSSNFRNSTAVGLAKSLKKNTVLEVLNLESNWLDPDGVKAIANQLKESTECAIHTWRFANQMKGNNFGRPVEEAIADMLDKNEKITKLGFSAQDPHWKNQIDRKLLKNADASRRKRKAEKGIPDKVEELAATKKSLVKLCLEGEPEKAIWELFEDDDEASVLMRRFMSERKVMPTRDQLLSYARAKEVTLKFAQVSTLMHAFRKTLLDNMIGITVSCVDEQQNTYSGALRSWKEKNDRMTCEVQGEVRWMFTSSAHVPLQLSDVFADWLEFVE